MNSDFTVTAVKDLTTVRFEKGRVFEMKNRSYYGLSFCTDGGLLTYKMNGKEFVSDQNTAVLLLQGGSYTIFGNRTGSFPVINFSVSEPVSSEIVAIPLKEPKAVLTLCDQLRNLFFYDGDRFRIYSVFYEILWQVLSPPDPKRFPLAKGIELIEKRLSDPTLSNTVLASELGVSEVYLRKLFSTLLQTSPRQYILEFRIRKAQRLLSETSLTVTQIAEECGFSGVYYFCRAFKTRVGMTPREYAAKAKVFPL